MRRQETNLKASKNLPNAIIIGSAKCGTGTLLEFISAHPDVRVAPREELQYFDIYYHLGIEWYRNQMPYSTRSQMTLEKTADYFKNEQVPERVHKLNPNMKLIVVVRDPVIRAVSHYIHMKTEVWSQIVNDTKHSNKSDSNMFAEMIFTFDDNNNNTMRKIDSNMATVFQGLYYRHVQNWLEYFPLKQILFLNGERLRFEPSIEIEKLQLFLNLKPLIKREHFVMNASKGFSCVRKPLNSEQVKCLGKSKGRPHPNIDESILKELRGFYRRYNKLFFNLINEEPWWPI